MDISCRMRIGPAALAAAVPLIVTGPAAVAGEAPLVQIKWLVNGGPLNTVVPAGTDLGDGTYEYEGVAVDPTTGLSLNYSLEADPAASIGGQTSILNETEDTIVVAVQVTMAYAHPIVGETDLSAFVSVGLTTGTGGGTLASMPPSLWRGVADNVLIGSSASLFFDPFFLSQTGIGSSATSSDFGIPNPVPGPPVDTNIGYTVFFSLTDGDVASVSSTFTVSGCIHDLDGDGAVAFSDLGILLANWGPCGNGDCLGDFNGDGIIDIVDMLELLVEWGVC